MWNFCWNKWGKAMNANKLNMILVGLVVVLSILGLILAIALGSVLEAQTWFEEFASKTGY